MRRILLVDDDHGVVMAMERTLRAPEKYSILSCTSAVAALQLAEHKGFDLVISDYRMPEMDGVTFLGHFRALQPDAGRIIVSGHSDREALYGALNVAHVYRYLEKPWDGEQVRNIVAEALIHRDIAAHAAYLDTAVEGQQDVIENQEQILRYIRRNNPEVLLRALANYDVANVS